MPLDNPDWSDHRVFQVRACGARAGRVSLRVRRVSYGANIRRMTGFHNSDHRLQARSLVWDPDRLDSPTQSNHESGQVSPSFRPALDLVGLSPAPVASDLEPKNLVRLSLRYQTAPDLL